MLWDVFLRFLTYFSHFGRLEKITLSMYDSMFFRCSCVQTQKAQVEKMPEPPRLTSLSHGGGCGCKIAPSVITTVLLPATILTAFVLYLSSSRRHFSRKIGRIYLEQTPKKIHRSLGLNLQGGFGWSLFDTLFEVQQHLCWFLSFSHNKCWMLEFQHISSKQSSSACDSISRSECVVWTRMPFLRIGRLRSRARSRYTIFLLLQSVQYHNFSSSAPPIAHLQNKQLSKITSAKTYLSKHRKTMLSCMQRKYVRFGISRRQLV